MLNMRAKVDQADLTAEDERLFVALVKELVNDQEEQTRP
jgi:hypothetical protein